MSVEVVRPGLLTSLQDTGRPGYIHLGVGRAGAFDAPALRIANALCGNPRDACGLEVTLIGPTLRVHASTWIAVTGAPLPVSIDGRDAPMWAPLQVPAGATVALGPLRSGCRAYFAIRGGLDVQPVLGSRSIDVNAALGPCQGRSLRAGDVLAVGTPLGDGPPEPGAVAGPKWRIDPRPWFDDDTRHPLRLLPGKHLPDLTQSSRDRLFSQAFSVQTDSNRVGVRLAGPNLELAAPIEVVSEGCVPGVLELPPSGQPIAFGVECPVSGGYPRIGQIAAVDLPRLAQLRPGDEVRFMPCTLEDALRALRRRERGLQRLEAAIASRLRGGLQ